MASRPAIGFLVQRAWRVHIRVYDARALCYTTHIDSGAEKMDYIVIRHPHVDGTLLQVFHLCKTS